MSAASSPDVAGARRVALVAAAVVVLSSPTWLQLWNGAFSSFPLVSVVYLLVIVASVAAWGQPVWPHARPALRPLPVVASVVAATLVVFFTHRLVDAVLHNPPDPARGDMLTVIEQAGRRFLRGRNPYGTYQLPWEVSLPYGPPLWAPFLLPQVLRVDLRLLTVVGQIFVPVCCGVIAFLEASRARPLSAAAWILLLATLAFNPDLLRFVSVGHTPAYWPLLPLLAVFVAGERWYAAALVLGVLVAGRATMAAMVPVFLMAVWYRDRPRAVGAGLFCVTVIVALLLPFFAWDPAPMWRGMITNHVQGVKEIVWHSPDQGAIRTIGLTGWLLSHGLDGLVDWSLLAALAVVYSIAWRGIRRGARALPFMSLALFAFSMTTVWPVYYVHFDVALLLASAALAEAAGAMSVRRACVVWPLTLACSAALVAVTVRVMASPRPSLALDQPSGRSLLRQGFSGLEDDGVRRYSWIDGSHAVLLLPRSSASAADLVVTGQPFVPPGSAPQPVTATLNGSPLGTRHAPGGWQTIRFEAPASAWRIGANQLELQFPEPRSLKELGLGDDPRHLTLAVQRIDVEPR